ncbi:Probable NAD(P)H dehydrogenase (quinone) FQR1-like 2 [Linum perenne]
MKKGVDGVEGVEAVLYRVPETLSSEVLEKMKAPPKDPSIPDITEAADLVEADGILFGFLCEPPQPWADDSTPNTILSAPREPNL